MTFHRRLGAHAVEQHKFLAVLLNDATAALFVARQHAAKHDEIGTAAKGFCDIARRGAATVADDHSAQTVRRIGTFDYRRKLRITDACFDASCTNRTWANANFNDISTGEDKLLTHFTSHYVASTNGFGRPRFTRFRNELHEVFGITIRHINTNEV